MNLKSEKGVTGIDISIAIIILTIFIAIIASLFYSVKLTSVDIERKKEATSIAIKLIEELKIKNFTELQNEEGYYKDENDVETSYYKEITITDYADMEGNTNKVRGLVKKVTVKISYKVGKDTKSVELSTIREKEI